MKIILNEQQFQQLIGSIILEFSDVDVLRLEKAALKHYGNASDYTIAGYITPSGHLLDFSEGSGSRAQDHRNIGFLFDELGIDKEIYGTKDWETSSSGGMYAVLDMGFIRFMPESNGIDMHKIPSQEQFQVLRSIIRREDGEVILDLANAGGNNNVSVEYEKGTPVDYIMTGIKNYYREGMTPRPYDYIDDEDLY